MGAAILDPPPRFSSSISWLLDGTYDFATDCGERRRSAAILVRTLFKFSVQFDNPLCFVLRWFVSCYTFTIYRHTLAFLWPPIPLLFNVMFTLLLTEAAILDLQPEYNLESLSTPCWWLELIILPQFSSSISWMFDVSVTYKYNTVYTFSYGAVQFEFTIGPPSLHHSIYLFIYPFNYVI